MSSLQQDVYPPSDDTYLLLDGLSMALQDGLIKSSETETILEIGCGTGVATVYVAQHLKESKAMYHMTDVNPQALQVGLQTAVENGIPAERILIHECDLASAVLTTRMDVILFNPPYVPTPDDEVGSKGIEASWAGGERGRRVIDRALPQFVQLLRPETGQAYMITVDDNEPFELAQEFAKLGLVMVPWLRRRARNEYLTVQRITWK
jgi:release factor glutamine methyltransferase